jgi:hypothetical protein
VGNPKEQSMHGAFGAVAIVGLIAFAFGRRTAQFCVGAMLILAALAFVYVMARVVEGTI